MVAEPDGCGWVQDAEAVMVLLNIAEGTSRVHASRRVFEQLHRQQNDIPVIHHRIFPAGAHSQHLAEPHSQSSMTWRLMSFLWDGLHAEDPLSGASLGHLAFCEM